MAKSTAHQVRRRSSGEGSVYGALADKHPELRAAAELVREAADAPDPRPKVTIAVEALRRKQGGQDGLAVFIGRPGPYIKDLMASAQSGRHYLSPAPATLSPNDCLQRAREIVNLYAQTLED